MAGTLLDESADMNDLLATLVDLARRGYLQIVEDRNNRFRFTRLRGADGTLRPYERLLFDTLFGRRAERRLDDLKHTFSESIAELESSLYDETVKAGYFVAHPEQTRTNYMLAGLALTIVTAVGGIIGYIVIFAYAPLAILVVIATIIVGIALAILVQYMPATTRQGAVAAARWRAFKRYLQHIDRYTEVSQAREQFEQHLPYAIAFGIEKDWIRTFEQVNTPAPDWYQPHAENGQGGSSSTSSRTSSSDHGSRRSSTGQVSTDGQPSTSGGPSSGSGSRMSRSMACPPVPLGG